MMKHFLKGLDFDMENKGEEIVVSIKGDAEKLSFVEKKIKAMKELCGDGCGCHCDKEKDCDCDCCGKCC